MQMTNAEQRKWIMDQVRNGRGLPVNGKYQPQTTRLRDFPALRWLLKHGHLKLWRDRGTGRKKSAKRQTYIIEA